MRRPPPKFAHTNSYVQTDMQKYETRYRHVALAATKPTGATDVNLQSQLTCMAYLQYVSKTPSSVLYFE